MASRTPQPETVAPPVTEEAVRLSVNLAPDVADALKELVRRNRTSLTEEVRRAISLYKFFADEVSKGHKIMVQRGEKLLEIKFL